MTSKLQLQRVVASDSDDSLDFSTSDGDDDVSTASDEEDDETVSFHSSATGGGGRRRRSNGGRRKSSVKPIQPSWYKGGGGNRNGQQIPIPPTSSRSDASSPSANTTITSGRRAGHEAPVAMISRGGRRTGAGHVSVVDDDGDDDAKHRRPLQRHGSGSQGSFALAGDAGGDPWNASNSMLASSSIDKLQDSRMAKPMQHHAISMKDMRQRRTSEGRTTNHGDGNNSPTSPSGSRTPSSPRSPTSPLRGGASIRPDQRSNKNASPHPGGGGTGRMSQSINRVGGFAARQLDDGGREKPKTVNGAFKLRKILNDLGQLRSQLKVNTEDIGDGAFNQIQATRSKLEQGKEKAAKLIVDIGESITCEMLEVKRAVLQLTDDIFNETDHRQGNGPLMAALARITSLDFPQLIIKRQWLEQCCRDGCPQYLEIFLQNFQELQEHYLNDVERLQQLLIVANRNQLYRSRLFVVFARHASTIPGFTTYAKELQPAWQSAFEAIAAKPKNEQSDANEGRPQAMALLLGNPKLFQLNFTRESSGDKQTIFSRAARDGEAGLMAKILQDAAKREEGGAADTMILNRLSSDGSTALMQAVVANQLTTVTLLLNWKGIDIHKKHPSYGTAMEIALKKGETLDRELLRLLQGAYRKDVNGGAGTELKDETPDFMLTADELKMRKRKLAKQQAIEDGSALMRPMLLGSLPQFESLVRLMTEASDRPKVIRDAGEALLRTKVNLSQKLTTISHNVLLKGHEEEKMMIEIMDLTVLANERKPGSVDFFRDILNYVCGPMNWATVAIQKGWLMQCAKDTSAEFLEMLLGLEDMADQLPASQLGELVATIGNNQTLRIPMMKSLLTGEDNLQLAARRETLNPIFQQFFANIASNERAIPREDRNGRMQLLRFMLLHEYIDVDVELQEPLDQKVPGADGLNIFVRAAHEGDMEVVKMLLDSRKIRKIDRPIALDGSTALLRAVARGHISTAELLVQAGANVHYNGGSGGTPMEWAKKSRDPLLVAVVEGGSSGALVPPVAANSTTGRGHRSELTKVVV